MVTSIDIDVGKHQLMEKVPFSFVYVPFMVSHDALALATVAHAAQATLSRARDIFFFHEFCTFANLWPKLTSTHDADKMADNSEPSITDKISSFFGTAPTAVRQRRQSLPTATPPLII